MSERNLYREVDGVADVRAINREIRGEIRHVDTRDQITELKKRSDYLCTLTLAPSWQEKFGRKASKLLSVAKEENARTTRIANSTARRHGIDADYHPWHGSTR
jgi:hypothetical protein